MGVNLPAHLVVIKSTMHYAGGMFEEYSDLRHVLSYIGTQENMQGLGVVAEMQAVVQNIFVDHFADKGDFSVRVDVSGKHHDEVTELGTAFNNMAESLDGLEKMRNSFLANISHDLRTPMTTIAGFIDGINSGAIPPEKHEYYLGVISAEVHRLSRLVSQLLDVSKLESGERKFNYTDFDIAEVADLHVSQSYVEGQESRLLKPFLLR